MCVPVFLAGCAIDPPPADRFYRIEPAAPAAAQTVTSRIQVAAVEAAGVYNQRPLVLQRAEEGGALEQYHYHFWTEPPDLLLTDALVRYLRAALGEAQVYGPGRGVAPDLAVHARLRKLDQRITGGEASSVLALQFTISDRRGVVRVVDFEQAAPAGGGAPAQHAQALGRLSEQAFARLAEALAAVDAAAPSAQAGP